VESRTALRLTPAGLTNLEQGRDLGPARPADDPDEVVRQRLLALRDDLARKYYYFEGLVFAHEG
jgi:hypothetical protein